MEDSGTVEDIKVLVEVETGITIPNQVLIHNGKPLVQDFAKLSSAGIQNHDLLVLTP